MYTAPQMTIIIHTLHYIRNYL